MLIFFLILCYFLMSGKNDPLFLDDKSPRSSDDENDNKRGSNLQPGLFCLNITYCFVSECFTVPYLFASLVNPS